MGAPSQWGQEEDVWEGGHDFVSGHGSRAGGGLLEQQYGATQCCLRACFLFFLRQSYIPIKAGASKFMGWRFCTSFLLLLIFLLAQLKHRACIGLGAPVSKGNQPSTLSLPLDLVERPACMVVSTTCYRVTDIAIR
ncbi:unnamed protein product, partial [Discosporangium mesarthrocarpum]